MQFDKQQVLSMISDPSQAEQAAGSGSGDPGSQEA